MDNRRGWTTLLYVGLAFVPSANALALGRKWSALRMEASNKHEISKKKRIGLALSGGIFVASAGGAATMRGFQQQSIVMDGEERPAMEAFDYVSGLSGGIVPTILYSYAQDVDSTRLLDADFLITDPSQITPEVLNRRSEGSIFDGLTSSFLITAVPMLLYGLFGGGLEAFWTLSVWLGTLFPFGIKRNKFFLPISDEADAKDDSISPRIGTKAIPLANFIMIGEAQDSGRARIDAYFKVIENLNSKGFVNKFIPPEQITNALEEVGDELLIPYVASPIDVRNAFISSSSRSEGIHFQTNSVQTQEWGNRIRPFSLELLLGMGTNFIAMKGVAEDGDSLVTKVTLATSQRRTVPLVEGGEEKELLFVDGGIIDGLGVPALVQRKVSTIVASIWPHDDDRKYAKLYEKTKGESLEEWLSEAQLLGIGDIASYFGFYQGEYGHFMNQMFEDGKHHLRQLRETFDALYEAGKPLVATMKDLKTIENPFWGIEAGETVDLTIIYYTLPKSFAERIPPETVPCSEGSFTSEEFQSFPNFAGLKNFDTITKTWSIIRVAALSRRQANMSAYLGSWVINEAWEGLTVDGKKVFGGFKDLLENP